MRVILKPPLHSVQYLWSILHLFAQFYSKEDMKDVMVMEIDPITGAQPLLKKVFELQ